MDDFDTLISSNDDESTSHCDKQFYYWESIALVPKDLNPVIIKVFVSGKSSSQLAPFLSAVAKLEKYIIMNNLIPINVIVINSDNVKNLLVLNETSFINYLLESHIHFIITHMHQGMHKVPNKNFAVLMWNMTNLINESKRLYFHCGFPNEKSLLCPVWTQDKYSYLQSLENTRFVNKTLKIDVINFSTLSEFEVNNIYSFWKTALSKFVEETKDFYEGNGYFVKAPYTTNSEFARGCKTIEDIILTLRQGCNRYSLPHLTIPYLMVQVRMENNKEKRVVCLGPVPTYYASIANKSKGSAFKEPHEDLFVFASEAMKSLKEVNKGFIWDCLVRVDIFQRKDKSLVVNEFESFEAEYQGGTKFIGHDQTTCFLEEFWTKKIFDCYNKVVKSQI